MGNEDKFYVVFVGRRQSVCTILAWMLRASCSLQGYAYKSYKTHHEIVLAWVMYKPWWKRPKTSTQSSSMKRLSN